MTKPKEDRHVSWEEVAEAFEKVKHWTTQTGFRDSRRSAFTSGTKWRILAAQGVRQPVPHEPFLTTTNEYLKGSHRKLGRYGYEAPRRDTDTGIFIRRYAKESSRGLAGKRIADLLTSFRQNGA